VGSELNPYQMEQSMLATMEFTNEKSELHYYLRSLPDR